MAFRFYILIVLIEYVFIFLIQIIIIKKNGKLPWDMFMEVQSINIMNQ